MKRVYEYKGFQIDVELDPVWMRQAGVTVSSPVGFVPIVSVIAATTGDSMRAEPDRLTPLPTAADGLMAGFTLGQRWIDAQSRSNSGAT
ncbi:hypothetical protein [Paraburkholderia antibiotica]|uniref:Uncharacterized protein n=1 Tax=Paraburkholderia antibiotica TaxID=2728839 RepID=A0A7Y0FG13_9BURK|nr:hypothetical protein [Paraburkholderia antibiotica]NML34595.1 hypothetical protein [Paraburkholderia antibiotica]